jgi:hypothetical protein
LELLAFDEKSTFKNPLSKRRARDARARCMKKIYGNPRSCTARTLCIDFLVAKNTVLNLVYYSMCTHEHVLNLVHTDTKFM